MTMEFVFVENISVVNQENVLGVANLYFVSFSLTNQQNLLKIFTAGA